MDDYLKYLGVGLADKEASLRTETLAQLSSLWERGRGVT